MLQLFIDLYIVLPNTNHNSKAPHESAATKDIVSVNILSEHSRKLMTSLNNMSSSTSLIGGRKPTGKCPRCPHRLSDLSTHVEPEPVSGISPSEALEEDISMTVSSVVTVHDNIVEIADTLTEASETKIPERNVEEPETSTKDAQVGEAGDNNQAPDTEDIIAKSGLPPAIPEPWAETAEAQTECAKARITCPTCFFMAIGAATMRSVNGPVSSAQLHGAPLKSTAEERRKRAAEIEGLGLDLCSNCEKEGRLQMATLREQIRSKELSSSPNREERTQPEVRSTLEEDQSPNLSSEEKGEEFDWRKCLEEILQATGIPDTPTESMQGADKVDTVAKEEIE